MTGQLPMPFLKEISILPVLTIGDRVSAVPLARALVRGGLKVLEITLRTEYALEAIEKIAGNVPGAIVGAGSVLEPRHMDRAAGAGARFCVSPGFTEPLIAAADRLEMPFLPGIATPSEALHLMESGYEFFKFFPAEALGGVRFLKSLSGPMPNARFCPTGGIGFQQAQAYLALENVVCVGGSWVCPRSLVTAEDWSGIESLARQAASLQS